jgi:hypothetical protein
VFLIMCRSASAVSRKSNISDENLLARAKNSPRGHSRSALSNWQYR